MTETCRWFKVLHGKHFVDVFWAVLTESYSCHCTAVHTVWSVWRHIYLTNSWKRLLSSCAAKWKITNRTEGTERSPKDRLCISILLLRPPPPYHCTFPLFPSSCLSVLCTLNLVVTIITTERLFGVDDVGQRGLDGENSRRQIGGSLLECRHFYCHWDFCPCLQCNLRTN